MRLQPSNQAQFSEIGPDDGPLPSGSPPDSDVSHGGVEFSEANAPVSPPSRLAHTGS